MRQRQNSESSRREPQEPAAPRATLEVARIGGGESARLGALVVVGVLVAVVWVGLSNRPPTVGSPQTQDPAVAHATPAPSLRHAHTAEPVPTQLPAGRAAYAVTAKIGNLRYVAVMDELTPGNLSATLRLPIPVGEASGLLDVTQLIEGAWTEKRAHVEQWTLPLEPYLSNGQEPELVIDAALPPRPNLSEAEAPPALRSGFKLKVYVENDLLFGIVSIEMTLNEAIARSGPRPADPEGAAPTTGLNVVATLGNQQFMTMLEEDEAGNLSGEFRVPLPLPTTEGTLDLSRAWMTVSHDAWAPIGSWDLRLASPTAVAGNEYIALNAYVPSHLDSDLIPGPVSGAYQITVREQPRSTNVLVIVEIRPR